MKYQWFCGWEFISAYYAWKQNLLGTYFCPELHLISSQILKTLVRMLQIKIGGCREFESLKVSVRITFLVTNSEIFHFMNTSRLVKDTTLIQTYSISLLGLRQRQTPAEVGKTTRQQCSWWQAAFLSLIPAFSLVNWDRYWGPLIGCYCFHLRSLQSTWYSQHRPAWSIMNTEVMTSGWCWRKDMEMLTFDAAPPYVCSHTTFRRLVNILQVIRSFLSFPGCLSPNIYRH